MELSKQIWFPGGVLLLAVAGLQLWGAGLSATEPFLTVFFLLALAAGAVAGMDVQPQCRQFPWPRLVVLGAAAWLLPTFYADAANGAPIWRLQILALLLPFNLILFSLLPDRGLRARTTLLGASALAVQAVALALLRGKAVSWTTLQLAR